MSDRKPYVSEVITDPEVLKSKHESQYGILVRIEKHGNSEHKTEDRIFARDIHEHYCDEPSCEFYGKTAAQGICYTTEPLHDWKNFERSYASAHEWLQQLREICDHSDDKYVDRLESEFTTIAMNTESCMDECIRLRAENAQLKNRLGEYK